MKITFIGHGYVGIVTACVFADLGNTVYVIGHTPEKLERLKAGDPLIYEPGLKELLEKNLKANRLIITDSYTKSIPESDIVFIAVGTPPKEDGNSNLSTVYHVAEQIGKNLNKGYTVVSCKSTVPVGTNEKILTILSKNKIPEASVDVASCPEFLREGSALNDTFNPDRIVIGSSSQKAKDLLLKLHEPFKCEKVLVDLASAELIKHASNSFLATKISYANLISFLCEKTGANVEEVLEGVGFDKRIGRAFLYPGVGYGGSCFPKDVKALIHTGNQLHVDMSLLSSVEKINQQARENVLQKILVLKPDKKIAIWGLAFKPETDDIREAASTYIIRKLLEHDFEVTTYDPEAIKNTQKLFGETVTYAPDPYQAAKDCDVLVILTEWNEFKEIDLSKVASVMKKRIIIDGRNIYNPHEMIEYGITYISVGR
jgi:UDPglucose 6-dehydrogenase